MKTKNVMIPIFLSIGISSCSPAEFAASSRGKDQDAKKPVVTTAKISCAIAPGIIKLGDKGMITVTNSNMSENEVIQTVKYKSSGEIISQATLVKSEDQKSYKKQDNSENAINVEKEGFYTVSLQSKSNSQNNLAVCEVKAEKSVTPPPPQPVCQDTEKTIGSQVLFVIDNSHSNGVTDCPSKTQIGTFGGAATYVCQVETEREKAVSLAFETLKGLSKDELSTSHVAIASFPSSDDYEAGWENQSQGWISTVNTRENKVSSSLGFTRKPFGLTPYSSALDAASSIMLNAPHSEKSKVVVLVTDGESTDRNPLDVIEKSGELKNDNIKLITVFITGEKSAEIRKQKHYEDMYSFNQQSIAEKSGTWYDSSVISSFDEYISLINGNDKIFSLAKSIASPVDEKCQGYECNRLFIEVEKADELQQAFKNLIESEIIKCQ